LNLLANAARSLLLPTALLLASLPAHAQSPDTTIQQFVKAFNAGDIKTVFSLHTTSPSITDEVAPYQWQGPGTGTRWLDALDHDSKAHGDTDESVALGPLTRKVESPTGAYLIYPITYLFKHKGVAMSEPSQITFALVKEGTTWKIAAWTWTGPDPTPVK
jgi:hypothetical protein